MNILAQTGETSISGILESAPTDEIMVMFVVFTVFFSILMIVVTFCVTGTIRSIKTTSINARMAEKLVQQGVPTSEVEKLVRANRQSFPFTFSGLNGLGSRWRQANTVSQTMPGKPAPLRS